MVPEGWTKTTLEDYVDIKHGFAFKSEFFTDSGNYILMTPGNFYESGGFRDQGNKTKYYTGAIPDGYILKKDDVLLAMTEQAAGLLGSAAYVPEDNKYLHNQRLGLIKIKDTKKACIQYLYLIYNSPFARRQISEQSTGTKVKHTSPDKLKGVVSLIPPLSEQKKIAKILSTWDRAIEVTEKLLKNSQQQQKSLMQQLLTGKKRLPSFSGEWVETTIKNMGKIVSGGTPDTNVREYWEGNVLWMTPTDVTALKNRFISNTKRKITQLGIKNSSASLMPRGSLLVCTRATIGLMSISTTEITTNQGFKNVVPNKKHDVDFLYYLFNFFKNKFVSYACGSTFLELSKKDFEKLHFLCPDIEEQQKIASVLSAADKEIEILEQKLECLHQEKKALMQQLLTGKRRVKVDEDEFPQKETARA